VLAVTTAIALVAGTAVGLVPAFRSASDGLAGALHREFDTGDRRRARLRHGLVVVQMSIASLVLVALGVSVHSLVRLNRVALGFSARHLVYTGIDAARGGHDARTGPAFYERVREAVLAAPGVEAATLASDPPLLGYGTQRASADGAEPLETGQGAETPYVIVHPSYFETIGMPIVQGRLFDSRDRAGATRVAIVNATLAERWWPGQDPIGRRLRLGDNRHVVEVIGVAPDGKYSDVDEEQRPFIYLPLAQEYAGTLTVIARTTGARDTILRAIGGRPDVAFGGIGPIALADLLEISTLLPRTIVWTTIVFAGLALGLATFGLYSTVFYSVSQRRREIGIRTALGATPGDLLRLVLRDSGWVALLGAGVGVGVGLLLLPVAASIFYGIDGAEPAVLVGVSLLCAGLTVLTSYVVVRPWTRSAALELLRR
jgi:predicted permease